MTVLITQIGFVAAAVTIPAIGESCQIHYQYLVKVEEKQGSPAEAAAAKCTAVFSFPSLNHSAYKCFPFPYTKKLIDLQFEFQTKESSVSMNVKMKRQGGKRKGRKELYLPGTTPARVGPRPLKSAGGPSCLYTSLLYHDTRFRHLCKKKREREGVRN